MRNLILFLTVMLAAQVRISGPGGGGNSSGGGGGIYTHEYTITLGSSSQIPASQTNFTILACANITLGNGNSCPSVTALKTTGNGGYVTSSNGYDIAFSSTACASPTLLSWELVAYTGSSGAMEAWVLDSSLSAGQVIYACVGNSSITTFQGGSTGAAWNSNYLSVWHLPNGSSLTGTDSTTNANNGSPGNSPTAIPGQIDGGAGFTAASNQYILGSETINSSAETLNVWVYVPSIPSSTAQVAGLTQGNGAGTADHVLLITGTQGHPSYYVYNSGGVSTSGSSAIPTSQWVMLTGSVGAAGQFIYVNGVQQGFSANTAGFTGYSGPNLLLGGHNSGSSSASTNLTFNTDELELAKVQLSANWIATEFNNQSAPSSFMTWALVF